VHSCPASYRGTRRIGITSQVIDAVTWQVHDGAEPDQGDVHASAARFLAVATCAAWPQIRSAAWRREGAMSTPAAGLAQRALLALGFGLAALIHLAPLPGLSGAAALQTLYGLELRDADLLLLLRHRALMFGLLGIGLLGAIRIASWRRPLWIAGLVSAAGFIALSLGADHGAAIGRIVLGDVIAVIALLFAAPATWRRAPAPVT
jgi:hypothetical protein